MADEWIKIDLSAHSKKILKNLETAELMPILRKEMRHATAPVAPKVREAARNLPSQNTTKRREKGTSLRREVAKIIRMKLRINPREIMVAIIAVPHGGKSNLARVLEGELSPWKVKVFGHDGTEHEQAHHSFFYPTIVKLLPGIERDIESVLTKFEKQI